MFAVSGNQKGPGSYSNRNSLPLMRATLFVATARHVAAPWSLKRVGMLTAGLSRVGSTKRLRIWGSMIGKASRVWWSEAGRADHFLDQVDGEMLTLCPFNKSAIRDFRRKADGLADGAMLLHTAFT